MPAKYKRNGGRVGALILSQEGDSNWDELHVPFTNKLQYYTCIFTVFLRWGAYYVPRIFLPATTHRSETLVSLSVSDMMNENEDAPT
jgi:hypothetical protein